MMPFVNGTLVNVANSPTLLLTRPPCRRVSTRRVAAHDVDSDVLAIVSINRATHRVERERTEMALHGFLTKAGSTVATGLVGAVAYDVDRNCL